MTLKEFRQNAQHLGTIRNLSKCFLAQLWSDHQAGLGESFSALSMETAGDVRRGGGSSVCVGVLFFVDRFVLSQSQMQATFSLS